MKRDLDCFCGWDEHMDAGATVVPKAANAREIQVIDNELMADPVFQLQRHGFAKGEYVAEFNVKGGSIFKLKAIEKDAAKPFDDSLNACIIVLEEHALFREPFVAKVTFATFVRDFRPKGDFKPQVRVTTIQPSIIADKDHMKIAAYFALQHFSEETKSVGDMNGSLMYLVQPKELRAAKPFKKGRATACPYDGARQTEALYARKQLERPDHEDHAGRRSDLRNRHATYASYDGHGCVKALRP